MEKKDYTVNVFWKSFTFDLEAGEGTERGGEVMSMQEMVYFNVPNTAALNIFGGGYNT